MNFDASLVFDKGLSNYLGHNNCFLNSAVQVLWHLDVFRKNFLNLKYHYCIQGPCIYCSLQDIFKEFKESNEDVIHPDMLRVTLASAFEDQFKFQLGEVDDASECYENILSRIHFHLSQGAQDDCCSLEHCITHMKFSMSLIQQSECLCGSTSEPLSYSQLVHFISTSSVVKITKDEIFKNFGNVLRTAYAFGHISSPCSTTCQSTSRVTHTLLNLPDVVSIGLIWDSNQSDPIHIKEFVSSIETSIVLEDLFDKVVEGDGRSTRELVGVVCYYLKHYSTFFFHSKKMIWISFDDASVNEIGKNWSDVVEKCCKGKYQPLLLIYQNPNANLINASTSPYKTTYINKDFEACKSFRNKSSNNSLRITEDPSSSDMNYSNNHHQHHSSTIMKPSLLSHNSSIFNPHPIYNFNRSKETEEIKYPSSNYDDLYRFGSLNRMHVGYDIINDFSIFPGCNSQLDKRNNIHECQNIPEKSKSENSLLNTWAIINRDDIKTESGTSQICDNKYPMLASSKDEPLKETSHWDMKELDEIVNKKLFRDKVRAIYR